MWQPESWQMSTVFHYFCLTSFISDILGDSHIQSKWTSKTELEGRLAEEVWHHGPKLIGTGENDSDSWLWKPLIFRRTHILWKITWVSCFKIYEANCVNLDHVTKVLIFSVISCQLGSYECKLCLTLHNNEGSYLAHTQGKKHQANLARRAAKEAKDAPQQVCVFNFQ